jgi:hypothetical protein
MLVLIAATYALAIAWTGGALLGLRLFWAGTIGSRAGNHPHCRGCDYDLFGSRWARCPECGRTIAGANAIVRGTRRPNERQAALGAAVIAMQVFFAGLVAAAPIHPSTIPPTTALTINTGSNAGANAGPSSREAREG